MRSSLASATYALALAATATAASIPGVLPTHWACTKDWMDNTEHDYAINALMDWCDAGNVLEQKSMAFQFSYAVAFICAKKDARPTCSSKQIESVLFYTFDECVSYRRGWHAEVEGQGWSFGVYDQDTNFTNSPACQDGQLIKPQGAHLQ